MMFSAGADNCTIGSLVETELMKSPMITARRIMRQFIEKEMKKDPTAGLKLHILKRIKICNNRTVARIEGRERRLTSRSR
jgi:hypothetical protein